MHITKIELEDIKSHAHFAKEFTRGTTAITGENGSGKTTLIEAVAWTLFDLLDYKKDDFVRRGAKKGAVDVTFESGLDGREYRVHRDTGTGPSRCLMILAPETCGSLDRGRRSSAFSMGSISALNRELISKHFFAAPSAFRREHLRRSFSKRRPNAKRLSTNF